MVGRDVEKALALGAIFVVSLLGGSLVLFMQRESSFQALSLVNCVCGGILMSAGLCHMLAETDESIASFHGLNPAHFLSCIGFFVAFAVEKLMGHGSTPGNQSETLFAALLHNLHDEHVDTDSILEGYVCDLERNIVPSPVRTARSSPAHPPSLPEPLGLEEAHPHAQPDKRRGVPRPPSVSVSSSAASRSPRVAFPVMLFCVLSCENFISGAALGSQTEQRAFVIAFIAIVSHIWAGTLTVAVAVWKQATHAHLTASQIKRLTVKSVLQFSVFCPLGILAGMGLQFVVDSHTQTVVSAVLLSLASGAFIFIAIVEVMMKELNETEPPASRALRFAMVLLGFFAMTALVFVA